MLDILRDKKVIFFDVGYTLDAPASGDWMFTNKFLELAGEKLKQRTETEIQRARDTGLRYLNQDHLILTVEAEIRNFFDYYSIISDQLDLGLSEEERDRIAQDRACNMKNYIPYPGIVEVLSTLSTTYKLGIISDTCSFATDSPDGICPNVRCCRDHGFDGCYECDSLESCEKGFYASSNDGANAAKAQALYIRKYGNKEFLKVQDRLHAKYEFAKAQEILGQDYREGFRILEEN